MNINDITNGMTPQEKDIYFNHMEKRHREEKEKIIADILKCRNDFTYEELKKKPIRVLEMIF